MWTEIWTFLTILPPLWTILLNIAYVVTWTFGKSPSPCHVHMVCECPQREFQMVSGGQKLAWLHMGLLIGLNIAHWYEFCHIKNAKFELPPAMSHK